MSGVIKKTTMTVSQLEEMIQKRVDLALLRERRLIRNKRTGGKSRNVSIDEKIRRGTVNTTRDADELEEYYLRDCNDLVARDRTVPQNKMSAKRRTKIAKAAMKKVGVQWTKSDDAAIEEGCWWQQSWSDHFHDSLCEHFYLWEGDYAGRKFEFLDWQLKLLVLFGWARWDSDKKRSVRRFSKASVFIPKKNGKMSNLSMTIPCHSGTTTFGEVQVGDTLFDNNGDQCQVTHVHPIDMNPESYEVVFSNGEKVKCCADHLWSTETILKPQGVVSGRGIGDRPIAVDGYFSSSVKTTREISDTLFTGGGAKNHRFKLHNGIKCEEANLLVNPYLLGYWLGDGHSDSTRITVHADDEASFIKETNVRVTHRDFVNSTATIRVDFADQEEFSLRESTAFLDSLKKLGVLQIRSKHNESRKHIPREYLRASIPQRLSLLQGLMDSDGTIDRSGKGLLYVTKLDRLKVGVCELLASLGIKYSANLREKRLQNGTAGMYWYIQFHYFREDHKVFRLSRKLARMRSRESLEMKTGRSSHVHIVSAEKIPSVPMRCITVDSPSGEFLIGDTMIPTHNSPTGAIVGWYLLCLDGESGQKIFSAARDGIQAGIVHDHAINMRKVSPSILYRTRLNKTLHTLYFQDGLSSWRKLSGDNIRSQEGLNGSIIVDEAHVVDDRLERVLVDLGASRADSLWFQISTAGENPDTYGRRDFEYGLSIHNGEHIDSSYFFLNFSAPPDATDNQIAHDPKIWENSNPALGTIVVRRQFETALLRAMKRGGPDWVAFKQRRLNIWPLAATEGLGDQWSSCKSDYTIRDLYGMGGGLGVDASDSDDMTACVFSCKMDGKIILIPRLWITERSARRWENVADFQDWSENGWLTIVDGGSLRGEDTWQVEIDELIEEIGTESICADPTFCRGWLMGWMDKIGEENVVIAKQTINYYSAPMSDLTNYVSEGRLKHDGNPCLDWMFRNYMVKTVSGLSKPIRDEKRRGKKIDGVQASIMSIDALRMVDESADSCCYNDEIDEVRGA